MILFIYEGGDKEIKIHKTLDYLYFNRGEECIVASYCSNIYSLYQKLNEMNGFGDIVTLMRESCAEKTRADFSKNNPFADISESSVFSEIYLFFDYDFQESSGSLGENNDKLRELLSFFNNETDNGKLYINYPMVESFSYTKEIPDSKYYEYCVSREKCRNFKKEAFEFSFYKSYDALLFNFSRAISDKKYSLIRKNWDNLVIQNVKKANYICCSKNQLPIDKNYLTQMRIFEAQCDKYVNTTICSVSILNAFPLFLFEYFIDF